MTAPRCVSVIGWSGAGKTTLIAKLLPELRARGLRVLAVKHSGHSHPLHPAGSDTARLQQAGAAAVAWVTPAGLQLTLPGVELQEEVGVGPVLAHQVAATHGEGGHQAAHRRAAFWRA